MAHITWLPAYVQAASPKVQLRLIPRQKVKAELNCVCFEKSASAARSYFSFTCYLLSMISPLTLLIWHFQLKSKFYTTMTLELLLTFQSWGIAVCILRVEEFFTLRKHTQKQLGVHFFWWMLGFSKVHTVNSPLLPLDFHRNYAVCFRNTFLLHSILTQQMLYREKR